MGEVGVRGWWWGGRPHSYTQCVCVLAAAVLWNLQLVQTQTDARPAVCPVSHPADSLRPRPLVTSQTHTSC